MTRGLPLFYSSRVPPPGSRDDDAPTAAAPPETATAPSYARAGVDLDHDEGFVSNIARIARTTFRSEVLSGIGGFAGLFKTPDRYRDPVMVAGADGVGTSSALASEPFKSSFSASRSAFPAASPSSTMRRTSE